MTEIKLSPFDKKDLLELLDYALEKKLEEEPKDERFKWDNSGWYKLRVYQLKRLINGEKVYDNLIQSSLGNMVQEVIDGIGDDDY